jgi:3-oxoacyl-[acyl-carrier-protein] synthase II
MIEYGDADVVIAGGSEATVSPLGVGGFAAMRALSTRNDDPTRRRAPGTRIGTVLFWVKARV